MSYPKDLKPYQFQVGVGATERRYKFEHAEHDAFALREDIAHKQTIDEPPDCLSLPWEAWVNLARSILANEHERVTNQEAATTLFEACFKARGTEAKAQALQALKQIDPVVTVQAGLACYAKKGNSDRLGLIAELLHEHGPASKGAWEMLAHAPYSFEVFLGALENATWAHVSWKQCLLVGAIVSARDRHTRAILSEALHDLLLDNPVSMG